MILACELSSRDLRGEAKGAHDGRVWAGFDWVFIALVTMGQRVSLEPSRSTAVLGVTELLSVARVAQTVS